MTLDFTVMLYEFGLESCVIGKGTSFHVQEDDLTLPCTWLFYHILFYPVQSYENPIHLLMVGKMKHYGLLIRMQVKRTCFLIDLPWDRFSSHDLHVCQKCEAIPPQTGHILQTTQFMRSWIRIPTTPYKHYQTLRVSILLTLKSWCMWCSSLRTHHRCQESRFQGTNSSLEGWRCWDWKQIEIRWDKNEQTIMCPRIMKWFFFFVSVFRPLFFVLVYIYI